MQDDNLSSSAQFCELGDFAMRHQGVVCLKFAFLDSFHMFSMVKCGSQEGCIWKNPVWY